VPESASLLSERLDAAMGIDWQLSEQGRARVKIAVERALQELPPAVSDADVERLVGEVYRYVIERGW
jgi:hypothetical protein